MKKYLIISSALLLSVVVIVSGSKGQSSDKDNKKSGKILTVNITDTDTIINGKKFKSLSKEEKEEFRKMEKEMKGKHIKMERKRKDLDKEMQALNKKMMIIEDGDINTIDFDGDDSKIVIRKSIAPRAPRPPHHPVDVEGIPPFPELPELGEMQAFEFHINGERDENAQVFTFNDGGKRTVIKMMQASPAELKKIGAEKTEEIKMYPNPVKDQLTLSFNFSESLPVSITIYDEEGKQVKTETIKDYKAGNYEKTYSISEFENGSYLVEFAQKDKKIVRKIYINK
jgi:hypothetical protein